MKQIIIIIVVTTVIKLIRHPAAGNRTAQRVATRSLDVNGLRANGLKTTLPSSCGSSSQNMATETDIPASVLWVKAAPMDTPSIKLWRPSPIIIIHATGFTVMWVWTAVCKLSLVSCCKSEWSQLNEDMRLHYENMPIQIYGKFHLQKLKIFR